MKNFKKLIPALLSAVLALVMVFGIAACSGEPVQPQTTEVTSVTISNQSLNLQAGTSAQLTATVAPDEAKDTPVVWTSSNEQIAVVTSAGKVVALKEGSATVTATAGEKSATCQVTVTPVPPVEPTPVAINIANYGGYNEGAFVEFKPDANLASEEYTVSYRLNGTDDYTEIDEELIRVDGTTQNLRADIVGIKAGVYEVKVSVGSYSVNIQNVSVSAYDRSGYAHYGAKKAGLDGIGAYKNDGTPKDNAQIIYVTEETKNTVKATIDGVEYTGIVNILAAANKRSGAAISVEEINNIQPLIVRVIGKISAATWKPISYTGHLDKNGNEKPESGDTSAYYYINADDVKSADGTVSLKEKAIAYNQSIGKGDTDKLEISQEMLIEWGLNELQEDITPLNGLQNKINWDKGEFDSAFNNCFTKFNANVTFEGIGTDAELFQWGITWKQASSIEVRNLTFDDYTEDACAFEGNVDAKTYGEDGAEVNKMDGKYIWVHNNQFNEGKNYWDVVPEQDKHEGDGATDLKKNAYVTLSYNHYYKNHKTGLVGGGDSHSDFGITFHHNWYEDCNSRLPLGRFANMHMYNNYYDGSTGTNMSIRGNKADSQSAYAFVENCYFENVKKTFETSKGGVIKVYGCEFVECGSVDVNGVTKADTRDQEVTNHNDYKPSTASGNYCFDINTDFFYYDATDKKTDVTLLTSAEVAKEDCMKLAGVLK